MPPTAMQLPAARKLFSIGLSAPELFSGVSIVGFCNGILSRMHSSVLNNGWETAIIATFDISVLTWVAFWICPATLLRAPRRSPSRSDWWLCSAALFLCALPLEPFSWVALTALAFYLLRDTLLRRAPVVDAETRQAAMLLLAVCGTMFWGRLLLSVAGGPILGLDARLVGWMTGAGHNGNTIPLSDGSGYLYIAPGCSSISGISLAILCFTLYATIRHAKWKPSSLFWLAAGCMIVAVFNELRISAIIFIPDLYDLLHGPVGGIFLSWLSLGAMLITCHYGTRHARNAAA